jgi:hypothetical protein
MNLLAASPTSLSYTQNEKGGSMSTIACGRFVCVLVAVFAAGGCYEESDSSYDNAETQAQAINESCECLADYKDDFYSSGDVAVIEDALTSCFSLFQPLQITLEARCLPLVFESGVEDVPNIEIALECIGNCKSSAFVIPRYQNVSVEECRSYPEAVSFEVEGTVLGCVHDDLSHLLPIG